MSTKSSFMLLVLAVLAWGETQRATATVFTIQNRCSSTIWPATTPNSGSPQISDNNLVLPQGQSLKLNPPTGWAGRIWARTGCNFDSSGSGSCTTGDCGGLRCTGGGQPPVSLVEFTLNGDGGKDFYDVSLVDGYNVKVVVQPNGGSGDCKSAGCQSDLNASCPPELQVTNSGTVVACKSACLAFGKPEYCCTGDHNTAKTCPPTNYSMIFKNACPNAYSYAFDDPSSTRTCTGADYTITFC